MDKIRHELSHKNNEGVLQEAVDGPNMPPEGLCCNTMPPQGQRGLSCGFFRRTLLRASPSGTGN